MSKAITLREVKNLQKEYGYHESQEMINNGSGWKMEGSVGRHLMELLEAGVCYLPTKATSDYYGNRIPSRNDLKEGSKGTRQNTINFWQGVESGSVFLEHA